MDTPERDGLHWHWGRLAVGLVVIAVGVVFLLRNLGYDLPFLKYHNWWALFILVGAVGPLTLAAERYRAIGRMDWVVLHSLLSAVAVILVAGFFLLDLDWRTWWPLFIIYGGFWMLLKGSHGKDAP